MTELAPLAQGVLAWIDPHPDHGATNAGIVVDEDGITVIDALRSPAMAAPLASALEPIGLPIRRLVLTSSHVEFVGGSSSFPMAAVYGSNQVSAHLDQPPNIDGYRSMFPEVAAEFTDLKTRPVTHTVAEPAYLSAAAIAVPTSGQLLENLVVQVPAANVVFAGAMACFGVTPLVFDGDPGAWADALDVIVGYGEVIVPGHGPVGDAADVAALQGYLRACVAAEGDVSRIEAGPWDTWTARDYDEVNVERAALLAQGDSSAPPSMLRRLGLL